MKNLLFLSMRVMLFPLYMQSAFACSISPIPGWKPPTPQSAFAGSEVVVHAKVLSVHGSIDPVEAKVEILKTLKGVFNGSVVRTGSTSLCGIGELEVGKEYVFFTSSEAAPFISADTNPMGLSAKQVLDALSK